MAPDLRLVKSPGRNADRLTANGLFIGLHAAELARIPDWSRLWSNRGYTGDVGIVARDFILVMIG